MMDVAGRPGTWSGLALRVSQCVAAGASFAAMASSYALATNRYSTFRYVRHFDSCWHLVFLWSFVLACLDIYSLKTNFDLLVRPIVLGLVIGDWGMSILSFASASASAGVTLFFARDTNLCKIYTPQLCSYYTLSVILAFMTWSFAAASAASVFWLLVSMD
ncbi:hypothetical protein PR202_gb12374 [Eleusine coracana subsp. coracana]|uniref:CASP-like protein n=1 Tax=Eleusine coracana subsp. coracana TaxID=191504 RepID=A0AAV5EPY3_ELECO|nr:hypothetical protein PR202_gb12374 [Eleusine coracana subsp. coracana]